MLNRKEMEQEVERLFFYPNSANLPRQIFSKKGVSLEDNFFYEYLVQTQDDPQKESKRMRNRDSEVGESERKRKRERRR